MYDKEERLRLNHLIGVTDECYDILRKAKKKEKISMAKIVCNLIFNKYYGLNKTINRSDKNVKSKVGNTLRAGGEE